MSAQLEARRSSPHTVNIRPPFIGARMELLHIRKMERESVIKSIARRTKVQYKVFWKSRRENSYLNSVRTDMLADTSTGVI